MTRPRISQHYAFSHFFMLSATRWLFHAMTWLSFKSNQIKSNFISSTSLCVVEHEGSRKSGTIHLRNLEPPFYRAYSESAKKKHIQFLWNITLKPMSQNNTIVTRNTIQYYIYTMINPSEIMTTK